MSAAVFLTRGLSISFKNLLACSTISLIVAPPPVVAVPVIKSETPVRSSFPALSLTLKSTMSYP
jgi:hypothetical protein